MCQESWTSGHGEFVSPWPILCTGLGSSAPFDASQLTPRRQAPVESCQPGPEKVRLDGHAVAETGQDPVLRLLLLAVGGCLGIEVVPDEAAADHVGGEVGEEVAKGHVHLLPRCSEQPVDKDVCVVQDRRDRQIRRLGLEHCKRMLALSKSAPSLQQTGSLLAAALTWIESLAHKPPCRALQRPRSVST